MRRSCTGGTIGDLLPSPDGVGEGVALGGSLKAEAGKDGVTGSVGLGASATVCGDGVGSFNAGVFAGGSVGLSAAGFFGAPVAAPPPLAAPWLGAAGSSAAAGGAAAPLSPPAVVPDAVSSGCSAFGGETSSPVSAGFAGVGLSFGCEAGSLVQPEIIAAVTSAAIHVFFTKHCSFRHVHPWSFPFIFFLCVMMACIFRTCLYSNIYPAKYRVFSALDRMRSEPPISSGST
ncbi:hypothetical protein [Paenibacillus vulneris]|uniref:Uncharacterized protein n=1 Tax=Paenibacillus vulneris TaxID=1133364 RepID=A0ABW3UYT4_9BACL